MNYISLPYLDVAVTLKASLLVALRNAGFENPEIRNSSKERCISEAVLGLLGSRLKL